MSLRFCVPLFATVFWILACFEAVPDSPTQAEPSSPPSPLVGAQAQAEPEVAIDVPGFHLRVDAEDDGGSIEIRAGDFELSIRGEDEDARIEINVPNARVRAGNQVRLTESELGLPFYPDALPRKGGRVEAGEVRILAQEFFSDDDLETVAVFYEQRLEGFEVDRDEDAVGLELEIGNEQRSVSIWRAADGGSRIALVYTRGD